jgi:septum formation topological specificity factor MinE
VSAQSGSDITVVFCADDIVIANSRSIHTTQNRITSVRGTRIEVVANYFSVDTSEFRIAEVFSANVVIIAHAYVFPA